MITATAYMLLTTHFGTSLQIDDDRPVLDADGHWLLKASRKDAPAKRKQVGL